MDELDHGDIQDDNNQHNLPEKKRNQNYRREKQKQTNFSLLEMVHVVLEFQLK